MTTRTTTAAARRGEDAAEPETTGPDGAPSAGPAHEPAPARTPQAAPSPGQVEAARALLLTHRLDVESGGCAGCGAPCPCEIANGAAAVVVAAGAWNTLPPMRPCTGWTGAGAGAGEGRGGALARALTLFRISRARRQGPASRGAR